MTTTARTATASTATTIPGGSALARAFGGTMFTKTLYDNRRIFAVWALATGLLAMMYASFYPQISADSMANVPEAMRGFGFEDNASAAGYLQGAVFGLLVPLLVTFYGAATGARMISADEDSGYLDMPLPTRSAAPGCCCTTTPPSPSQGLAAEPPRPRPMMA